jgi:rhodanese-related sulfurtransferase
MTIELAEADAQTVDSWHSGGEALLVDVRETNEYLLEHIPGALLLPLSFLDAGLFPKLSDKTVVLVCQIGKRSGAAQKQLAKAGITNTVNLIGGIDAWREAGLELEGTRYEDGDYAI